MKKRLTELKSDPKYKKLVGKRVAFRGGKGNSVFIGKVDFIGINPTHGKLQITISRTPVWPVDIKSLKVIPNFSNPGEEMGWFLDNNYITYRGNDGIEYKLEQIMELNSLLEKNVPNDPSKWSYYKSQAKKKFDVYPSAYANAWAAKKYKAAGGTWKTESVNEYSRDDIHDNTPLHFGRDSKLGGLFYKRLKSKLKRQYGANKFKVVGRVVMLGNRKLFTISGSMTLNDIFNKILSMERQLKLNVNESNFKYDPNVDYFDNYKLLPKNVQAILNKHDYDGDLYKSAEDTIKKLNKVGWTADYDLSGDMFDLKPLGESVNEAMDKTQLKAIYDKLQKGDELTIMYTDMWSGKTRGNFIVKKGKTKVGKAKVERITLINKRNPRGVKYYLYQRNGFVTFAIGDMAATIDSIVLEESVNETKRNSIYISNRKHKKESNMSRRTKINNIKKALREYYNLKEELPTKEIDPKQFPNPLPSSQKGFLKKGNYDGDKTDDIVATKPVSIPVSQLKPSQSAIYLGKALGMAVGEVEGGDLGAVISKDNYILDGHHRYAATTFNNPSAKVGGVQSDLMIGDLVPVLRAVGDAMKNKRGLEPKGGDVNIFKATMKDVKDAIYNGKNMNPQFYNKEKSIAWFEKIGEETIAKRLKMIQSKMPPSGAPARKDMPKIHPNQLGILKTLLNKGNIDVRKPYTESVNEAAEPDVITQLRDIVSKKQNKKIKDPKSGKKMLVDLYSASAVTQVYDALKQSNKDKFVSQGLLGMVNLAFRLISGSKNESVNESVVDTNKISGEIDKISNEITKVTTLYTNAYKKNDVNNYIKYRDKLLNLTNKHIKLIQNMSDTIKATKVNKVNESVNESRTEWYELDEWEDRLKDAINKAKLNPKEKRYFLLRAGEIKSKYDAVELLNDLDAMVKKKVRK